MNSTKNPCRQTFALIEWLQSFPQFDIQIYQDRSNEDSFNYFKQQQESHRLISTLKGPEATLAVCKVVEEICETQIDVSPINNNQRNGTHDVWNAIEMITSSRARPLIPDQCRKSCDSSDTNLQNNLQLKVLSELLDCAIQSKDKQKRRDYIQTIMHMRSGTQKVIMVIIELRGPPNSSSKSKQARSQQSTTPGQKSPQRSTKTSSSSRRSSPSKASSQRDSSAAASRRSSTVHHASPCGPTTGQVMARMNCTSGGGTTTSTVSSSAAKGSTMHEAAAVAQNLFGEGGAHHHRPRSSSQQQSSSTKQPQQSTTPPRGTQNAPSRSVGFQDNNPAFLSPGTMESPHRLQSVIQNLQRKSDLQQQALEAYQEREEEMKQKLDKNEQDHRKAMMKVESESYDRLQDVKSDLEEHIGELTEKLEAATDEAHMGKVAMSELSAMREEMEVLQSNKITLSETSEKLRKCKAKLMEYADIKDALEREQSAHGDAVTEIVRLEQIVDQLKPVKRQAEDYKIRAIEAEVKLVECQDYMNRVEKRASAENSSLFKDMLMQKEQMEELRLRVQEDMAASSPSSGGAGIGEGISEMNPELKAELTRLRSENKHLRIFQAKRTEDEVQHLEESLDDCQRLMEKYKSQYLDTKDELANRKSDLERANQISEDLRKEIDQYKEQCEQYSERCERLENRLELVSNQLDQANHSLQNVEQVNEKLNSEVNQLMEKKQERDDFIEKQRGEIQKLQDMVEESQSTVHNLHAEVQRLESVCREKSETNQELNNELEELSREHAETKTILQQKETDLDLYSKKVTQLTQELEEMDQQLQEETERRTLEVEQAKSALETTREQLQAQHAEHMQDLQEKTRALLEEEKASFREKEEQLQQKLQQCDSTWRGRFKDLKDKSTATIMQERQDHQQKINTLEDDHVAELKKTRAEGSEKYEQLRKQGMELMETAKTKASNEIRRLRDLAKQSDEKCTQMTKEANEMQAHLEAKLQRTREELNFSQIQAEDRAQELEDLQEKMRKLEREKHKLSQDNENFRRKLGGQYGTAGEVQSKFAKLQKEFNTVVEENKQLKKERMGGGMDSISECDDDQGKPYRNRGGRVNGRALAELRREYEQKIDKLNDEKRELIQGKSSEESDKTLLEQRLHNQNEEMEQLRKDNINLQLKLHRSELARDTPSRNSMSPGKSSIYNSPSRIPRSSPSIDRAKKQKAAQEHLLRSRFQNFSGAPRTPPNESKVLAPLNRPVVLPMPFDANDDDEDNTFPKKSSEVFRVKKASPATQPMRKMVQAPQMNEDSEQDGGANTSVRKKSPDMRAKKEYAKQPKRTLFQATQTNKDPEEDEGGSPDCKQS